MIEAISGLNIDLAAVGQIVPGKEVNHVPGSFLEIVNKGLGELNNQVNDADKLLVDYVLEKQVSTHDLMIAMEKAKHSMQVAVEVRNRMVEAYQQITKMQV